MNRRDSQYESLPQSPLANVNSAQNSALLKVEKPSKSKLVIFACSVATIMTCELCEAHAYEKAVDGQKLPWKPELPGLLSNAASTVICFALIAAFHEKGMLRKAVYNQSTWAQAIIASVYCFQLIVMVYIKQSIGALAWNVLAQFKVIVNAGLACIFLNRSYSLTQWILLFEITISIICFSLSKTDGAFTLNNYFLELLAVLAILVTGLSAIASEHIFQRVDLPLVVHLASYSLMSLIANIIYLCFICPMVMPHFQMSNLFDGFNCYCFTIACTMAAKGFVSTYLIVYLDGVWKNLAYSTNMVFLIWISNWLFSMRLRMTITVKLLGALITCSIIAFALASENHKKMLALRELAKS